MMDLMTSLISLAIEFKEVAFSSFICLFVLTYALRALRSLQANGQNRKTYIWVIGGSGVLLAFSLITGIVWRMATQPNLKTFEGTISPLEFGVELTSRDLHTLVRASPTPGARLINEKDVQFLAVIDSSIKQKKYHLTISKKVAGFDRDECVGDGDQRIDETCAEVNGERRDKRWKQEIIYEGKKKQDFLLLVDESGDYRLEPIDEVGTAISFPEFKHRRNSLYLASPTLSISFQTHSQAATEHRGNEYLLQVGAIDSLGKEAEEIAFILQDERRDVETKLGALEQLAKKDNDVLARYMRLDLGDGPFAATVLDLSRHTNPLVSKNARNVLARVDLVSLILEDLNSGDEETVVNSIIVFSRLGRTERDKAIRASQWGDELNKVPMQTLVPTESSKGDRYYVRADWTQGNIASGKRATVFDCLTRLFNRELITNRTLEQEERLMEGRGGTRFVYWYSDEWARYIAAKIEECGAEAAFVDGVQFRPYEGR